MVARSFASMTVYPEIIIGCVHGAFRGRVGSEGGEWDQLLPHTPPYWELRAGLPIAHAKTRESSANVCGFGSSASKPSSETLESTSASL